MKKKLLLSLLLALFAVVACSQTIRAPVNVATKLYMDCMVVKFQTVTSIEPTRVGINAFVTESDEFCHQWAVIWYKPFFDQELTARPDIYLRYSLNRKRVAQELTDYIRKEALK